MSGADQSGVFIDESNKRQQVTNGYLISNLKGVPDALRQSVCVSKKSRYGDIVWDMAVENPDLHPVNVRLDFSLLSFDDGTNVATVGNGHYLRSLKEYAFSMLKDPPASRPKWSSFRNAYHRGVRHLMRYMHGKYIRSFSELTSSDLDQFLEELACIPSADGRKITNRTLRTRAYGLHWLYEQSVKLEDGLSCDPFAKYGSLSQWATSCCKKRIPKHGNRTVEMPDSVAKDLLMHALEDLSLVDVLVSIRKKRAAYIPQRVQSKGQVKIRNPFPWDKYGLNSGHQVSTLEARLAAAGYIVIAMLTGMRWHEVIAMKDGITRNWEEKTIEYEGFKKKFYFVLSKTNKLQAKPEEYRWQTLPIVKRALDALSRGLASRRKGGDFLFPSRQTVGHRFSDGGTGEALYRFACFHKICFEGKVWRPATHQFRKKFARIMIRQGLGMKALQDQLKHFDMEMTRGYGDMNLYVELQQEKFQLSNEQYDELLSKQVVIVGGGAAEVLEYRKLFLGMTKKERIKFLEELPKSAVIEQLDDGLCMYRPHKALCRGDRAACRPADCNNAVLPASGKRKTFVWRRQENLRLLEHYSADQLKVSYLTERIGELDKLLSQLDEAERSAGT